MNFAKKIFMLLIATSFIFTLYSCQAIIVGAYGIRDAKMMDVEAIAKLSDRIFNDSPYQYYVDSTFKNYLKSVGADASLSTCSVGESLIGDIKQPLKVYFFDRDRNFKNMFTNCKAGGFPNLNWSNAVADMNASDNLDSVRGKIVYNELSSYFMNLKSDAASVAEIDGPIVIVFWNKFMFRQSKRLVKFVAGRYGDTATIVYVNNDNFFYNAMF